MDVRGRALNRSRSTPQERIAECWEIARRPLVGGHAGADATAQLGRYRLRPAQVEAVRQVNAAIAAFGGALLADPPGAGKTIVALAVARTAGEVAVIAPHTLRAQWERSAARARVGVRFISIESLSRAAPTALARMARDRLVIIDEAHHLRTPTTRRYLNAAELCLGAQVLLLSATPVVNRTRDRDALLALFLTRPGAVDVGRCIIRRSRTIHEVGLPTVRRLPALARGADDDAPCIARLLHELPAPLPAADGAAALGLIRISLAMAWSSSLAALDEALRRRIQRGEAFADSLDAGEWPTRAALRQWVIGDDATQLALPGFGGFSSPPPAGASTALRVHLDAVRALRAVVAPSVPRDTSARAAALRQLLAEEPTHRVVVFARHAKTIRALWSALRGTAGTIAVVGDRVMAAEGRWQRNEVLAALGPRARPLRADDPRMIRLLLTTDLLAEGVELQGVDTLVHADLAWTPATLEQREGRVVRPSQPLTHGGPREVRITRFDAAREIAPMLRLAPRLARKDRSRARAVRGAECLAHADQAFAAWRAGVTPRRSRTRCDSFLAAIRVLGGEQMVVAGTQCHGLWRVESTPCIIARLSTLPQALPCDAHALRSIRQALARWLRHRASRSLIGNLARAPAAIESRRWRSLSARVDRALLGWTLAERAAKAPPLMRAFDEIVGVGGAGSALRLSKLLNDLRDAGPDEFAAGLVRLAVEVARPAGASSTCAQEGAVARIPVDGHPALLALVPLVSASLPRAHLAAAPP